jgi:hypothetical protein
VKNNPTGFTNQIVPIVGNYTFSPEDGGGSIQANFAGGAVTLPGPVSTPNNLPQGGDTYLVLDPQLIIGNNGKSLTINGGGYKFPAGGVGLVTQFTLTLPLTVVNTQGVNKSCLTFIFDGTALVWAVC